MRYDPPGDAQPVDVTRFKTQVPAFIDRVQLTRVLSSQDVVVNARAADTGRAFWANLLLGIVPTLLLVGFFVYMMRQQASGGGVMGSFGKSTARRVAPSELDRVTFDDVAGIDEAEQRAGGGGGLPQAAGALPQARRADPARRAALRAAGHGQDAARARRRG